MSNNLSIISVIEKNKLSSQHAWLVALDIEVKSPEFNDPIETLRLVNNTEDIVVGGNTYTAASFDIELKQEAGTAPEVNLSIVDLSRAVQARMQEYGGGIGFNVIVSVFSAADLTQPPELQEFFQVIGANAANYRASFQLGAENPVSLNFPRRRQLRDFCSWRYKSPECGYTGNLPSCDLSLQGENGCAKHNNTVRFGSYPGLNSRNFRYA